ncbi:MAG: DNA mismatch endonuclease Vsr [Thermoguttaceae bacterium]|nr:DNA mismatch endonuclease Vsr [Thermoguttaceae bacterium]
MADKFTPERRSEIMRAVKSKNNVSTELKLIAFFKSRNIKGWRRNYKVKGKPDFVFLDAKLAVFVDGCFWHGHTCKHLPKENVEFWRAKIERNKRRDAEVTTMFLERGWKVLRVWECELRKKNEEVLWNKFETSLRR